MEENFSFDTFDLESELDPAMLLDDAVQRASEMRREHPGMVYRVRPKSGGSSFRIEERTRSEVEAEGMRRLSRRWTSLTRTWSKRHA